MAVKTLVTILMSEINVHLCYSCRNTLIFWLDDYIYCYLNRRKTESSVSCLKKTSLSKYDVMQRQQQQCVRNSALWIWDISVPGKICIAFSSWNEHTFISFSGLILLTSSDPDKKTKKLHHTTNKKTKKNMWNGEDGNFPTPSRAVRMCVKSKACMDQLLYSISSSDVWRIPSSSFPLPPLNHPPTHHTHKHTHACRHTHSPPASCFIQQPMGRLYQSLKSAAEIM